MATGAVQAKLSGVNGRFLVTTGALIRRSGENRRCVAGSALQAGMCAFQREDRLVIKTNHGIAAVMTRLAILAKLAAMVFGEERFGRQVAFDASDRPRLKLLIKVAIFAGDRRRIKIQFMFGQAKISQPFVFE